MYPYLTCPDGYSQITSLKPLTSIHSVRLVSHEQYPLCVCLDKSDLTKSKFIPVGFFPRPAAWLIATTSVAETGHKDLLRLDILIYYPEG